MSRWPILIQIEEPPLAPGGRRICVRFSDDTELEYAGPQGFMEFGAMLARTPEELLPAMFEFNAEDCEEFPEDLPPSHKATTPVFEKPQPVFPQKKQPEREPEPEDGPSGYLDEEGKDIPLSKLHLYDLGEEEEESEEAREEEPEEVEGDTLKVRAPEKGPLPFSAEEASELVHEDELPVPQPPPRDPPKRKRGRPRKKPRV